MEDLIKKVVAKLIKKTDLLPEEVKVTTAELSHLDDYILIEKDWNDIKITARTKVEEYTWVELQKRVYIEDIEKEDKAGELASIIQDLLDKLKKIKKMWR